MKRNIRTREASSFRDPDGYVYYEDGAVFRQVNTSYRDNYILLKNSGLLSQLNKEGLIVPFKELSDIHNNDDQRYATLKVEQIPFISYPYEWAFSQLKDAALTTLTIQKIALSYGMSLKDASAYNIQFMHGKPLLIDVLSFELYNPKLPWIAYRQFCQHFLGPLLLMATVDVRAGLWLRQYIDGIPLDLVSKLLPKSSYLQFAILTHIHLHAKNQQRFAQKTESKIIKRIQYNGHWLLGLIDSLEKQIKSLHLPPIKTEWGDYYSFTNYSKASFETKKRTIKQWLTQTKPRTVWDLGANDGTFSRLASEMNNQTVAFDIDPIAVEKNYINAKKDGTNNLLPLIMDLTNLSPELGWALSERKSVITRGPTDMILSLALIHHICISNNVTFDMLASLLHRLGTKLIIEFIPKNDSKVQILLATRKDIFPWYNQKTFESAFKKYFIINEKVELGHHSLRTLYLMSRKK